MFAAKVVALPIALGVESRRFVHRHSADRIDHHWTW
jgi:hypothetical protein